MTVVLGKVPIAALVYWCNNGSLKIIGKVWLPSCDAIMFMSHTLQSALESGQEARIVQIDFSAAVDKVNHH